MTDRPKLVSREIPTELVARVVVAAGVGMIAVTIVIALADRREMAEIGLLGAALVVFGSICRYPVASVLLIADLPPIDVQRELAAMRAELAEMRVEQRDQLLDEARAEQIRSQRPQDKNKLYALHAPEVECIGKGKARVTRRKNVIFEGIISSLRRFQDEVNEVRAGMDCGMGVKNYNDIREGDQIEVFERVQVQRTL